jgi:diguanylate cyclase (GGDEF)-like protein/putative nucleotidyltransferase with HDIG domain
MDALVRTDADPPAHAPSPGAGLRDPGTGLFSAELFDVALEKELDRHHRYGTVAALLVLELDGTEGLDAPTYDRLRRAVAGLLAKLVRDADTLSALPDGRFGLLLPETTRMDAVMAAERLRTAIATTTFLPDRRTTLSGGVAALPQDGVSARTLFRRLEAGLAFAQRAGGDRCAVAREAADDEPEAGMLLHLHAVVAGIDGQDLATLDHSENVAVYATAMAAELGLDERRCAKIRRAAFLHDIGKIAVPYDVLEKPGALTDDEYAQVKLHPEVGGHMLAHARLREESDWVRHHHERLDGHGYPDRLVGEEIPLESRIIFVADSFEAMTSDRPYRRGMPVEEALGELQRCAGTQFDPRAVDVLCELVRSGRLQVQALRHAP